MAGQDRSIVVGYDGSQCSREALTWAVDEAQRRRRGLKIVYGLGWLVYGPPAPTGEILAEGQLRAAAERVAEEAMDLVAQQAPELDVSNDVYVEVNAKAALVEQSSKAELVVVGSRGRGGFKGLLLGSTSTGVAMHAHCPVVVVHAADETRTPGPSAGRVVVGIDGSDRAMDALAFAFAAASARGVGLTAVHGWTAPWIPASDGLPLTGKGWRGLEEQENLVMSETMAGWGDKYPDVDVTRVIVEANPARTLVEHSHRAALVVVGSRGHGGFTGLLLGSVSQTVVQHATCPVAVIPGLGHRR